MENCAFLNEMLCRSQKMLHVYRKIFSCILVIGYTNALALEGMY